MSSGRSPAAAAATLAALGIVFGDIGTSPLYAIQTVFGIDHGAVHVSRLNVYGVFSWVFWAVLLIVTMKYVLIVMRADNDGEGGVMALAALVRRILPPGTRWPALVMAFGMLGASLFYGDSLITPAISLLSAMGGLEVAAPSLSSLVLPLAVVVLVGLFALQRHGTAHVGRLFGPVMVLWFGALAVAGAGEVARDPAVAAAFSPAWAIRFFLAHPAVSFVAMGAIVLAITGAEALYADMGHFGPAPVRRAWLSIVLPALTLNYLGQSALVLHHPADAANPFYLLLPGWAQLPMLVLATLATVIASQAVISGAFSVTHQGVQLGLLPPTTVRRTSELEAGQVYLPAVNLVLFAGVLALMVSFGSSARLAAAYGIAVTGTFTITTTLMLVVARRRWHWPLWLIAVAGLIFGGVELMFFSANLLKVTDGGWLPLLVGAAMFTLMTTWQRGRLLVTARRTEQEGPLREFIDRYSHSLPRIPGTAVFLHPSKATTPLALRVNVRANHVLHSRVVIVSAQSANVPHVPPADRVVVDDLGYADDGVVHVTARFGFSDSPHVPDALRHACRTAALPPSFDPDAATFFVSRANLRRSEAPGMRRWRKRLFMLASRNAASPVEYFCLPLDRTLVMGTHVDL